MEDLNTLLRGVTTFVLDYDGVLTDGTVYMDLTGEPLRTSNVKDGYALQLASKLGYHLAIISGAFCDNIKKRMNALGVHDVFVGVPNKVIQLENYLKENNLSPDEVAFMGDDIPDMKVMQRVGVPACPADAAEEIKSISRFISARPGGKGCVRDLIEQTLKAQGRWMTAEAYSW